MSGIETAANDLFFKLRNRFPHITMGDEDSTTTSNPTDAKFFSFDYEENDVKFGNITASLIDGQNLKLYFSQDVTKYMDREEKQSWYRFLQEIRKFAKSHMLGLDVRDISKDVLNDKDLKFVSNQNKEKSQIGESRVLWARRGTVSEGDVGNVRVHVVHSERMDENPNNRLLRVDRIFLVNESGERFLLPFKSVMAAKAMANHVGRGGNPYDGTGKLISTAVNEMSNLRRFASATRRKTFESEDANQVITAAQAIKESIKRSLHRLANNTRFDENLEDLGKLLAEQEDVEDIKPYFTQTAYNENLDNWIGSAAKAFKQYKGNIMENLRESAGSVAQKLSDPNWLMVLKDEPSEDRLITTSKYADGRALLRRILGTIADRASMDDSDVANWASQIGQDMELGNASQQDMQIALQLAKRYQTDLAQMAQSPEYAKQIRVAAFGQKKDLYGKTKDESMEFEDYVNGVGEDGPVIQQSGSNPLPPMSAMDRIQQKLGTGPFAPQTVQPTNTEPLPGSPGAGPDDRAALTRMIDNESEEEPNEPSPDPGYPPPSPNTPDDVEEQVSGSAMDRISARVAARDGETTPMERVSERVATRTSADTVNEKAVTNEALDTMLWLSGVKKKSEVSEDVPEVELTKPKFSFSPTDNKFTQLPDKGFSPAPTIEPPTQGFSGSSDAPKITQTNITKEPPRINSAAPTIEPQTKTPTVQTGVAPEITVSNSDKLPSPSASTPFQNFLSKAGGIAAVGSALLNPTDPIASSIGLGQKSPSADDDEMSKGKAAMLSMPPGTITNPERQSTQSNNIQKPVAYSPDMTTPDRMRDLAGIGRK
jgi:hypothetical protein